MGIGREEKLSDKNVTPQPGPAPDCEEMREKKKKKTLTLKEMHIGASHEQPPVGAETSEMAPLPEVEFLQNVGKAVSGVMDMAVSGVESAENFLYDCACEASTKNWGWFDWVLDIPRGYCGEEEGSPFKYVGAVGKGIQEFATNIVKGTLNLAGHPVETAKGIGYAVMHREEVGNALKEHYWGSNTTTTQKVAGVTEAICDIAFLAYGAKKGFDKVSEWAKARKAAKMAETGEIAGEAAKAGEAGEIAEEAAKVGEAGAEVAEDATKAGGKGKVKIESSSGSTYKEVNIHGEINTEIDEVDLLNQIIYEDKSAAKLYMENPDFPQTEQQWAFKQIYKKGSNRIDAINQSEYTLSIVGSNKVPNINSLKSIKNYIFRIDADTPALRQAVEQCLQKLRLKYPEYNFSATYGGK